MESSVQRKRDALLQLQDLKASLLGRLAPKVPAQNGAARPTPIQLSSSKFNFVFEYLDLVKSIIAIVRGNDEVRQQMQSEVVLHVCEGHHHKHSYHVCLPSKK